MRAREQHGGGGDGDDVYAYEHDFIKYSYDELETRDEICKCDEMSRSCRSDEKVSGGILVLNILNIFNGFVKFEKCLKDSRVP
jgi:hypothetical protein